MSIFGIAVRGIRTWQRGEPGKGKERAQEHNESFSGTVCSDNPVSIACLFLVSEGQDVHRVVGQFMMVQGDIARITKRNNQFTQLRHFRKGSANVGSCFQQQELPFNSLTGSSGGFWCLGLQEQTTPLQAC